MGVREHTRPTQILAPVANSTGAIFCLQLLNTPTRPGDDAPGLDKTPQ